MTFYNDLVDKYFEKINTSSLPIYKECIFTIFNNWPIERIKKTKFITTKKIKDELSSLTRFSRISFDKKLLYYNLFDKPIRHTCSNQKEYDEIKEKHSLQHYYDSNLIDIEEEKELKYAINHEEAVILQRQCLTHGGTFVYHCLNIEEIYWFSRAITYFYTIDHFECDEKTFDMLAEITTRGKFDYFGHFICRTKSIIKKFDEFIANVPKKDMHMHCSYWVLDEDEDYYDELIKKRITPFHPISEKSLAYIAKVNFNYGPNFYEDLSVHEVFTLIDLGYSHFPSRIKKLHSYLDIKT